MLDKVVIIAYCICWIYIEVGEATARIKIATVKEWRHSAQVNSCYRYKVSTRASSCLAKLKLVHHKRFIFKHLPFCLGQIIGRFFYIIGKEQEVMDDHPSCKINIKNAVLAITYYLGRLNNLRSTLTSCPD